jgi:hypothetical protein
MGIGAGHGYSAAEMLSPWLLVPPGTTGFSALLYASDAFFTQLDARREGRSVPPGTVDGA